MYSVTNKINSINVIQNYNKSIFVEDIILRFADNLLVVNIYTINSVTKKITAQAQTAKFAAYIMQLCKNNNVNVQLANGNVDNNSVYFTL